jgi:hypothetical protein
MSQNQNVTLAIAGLFQAPNDFSGVPQGALDEAINVAIDQRNIASCRHGFNWFNSVISGSPTDYANRLTSFKTSQIGSTSTEYTIIRRSDNVIERDAGPGETAGNWYTWPGTFADPASDAKLRFFESNRRKYCLTSQGPYLLDVISGNNTATPAGVPKALDLVATVQSSPGFLTPNAVVSPTATATSGSATLTNVSSTSSISVGMYASALGTYATLVVQDLTYTSLIDGTYGNSITITYVNPGVINSALAVTVAGTAITLSLATNGAGTLTSTATQVLGAINGSTASTLVSVSVSGTGSNVQTAASVQPLAGGATGAIPSGTKVTAITDSSPLITQTGSTTAGSTSVTALASNAGIVAGVLVTGDGIQSGTTVASISGAGPYTVVLSKSAYKTGTGVTLSFASAPSITLSNQATANQTAVVTFYRGAQVGYRLLFIGRDSVNSQLLYGSPSGMAVATNTLNRSVAVSVTTNLPTTLSMGPAVTMYVQLYRSAATADATISPLDQMQLVYEAKVTAANISAGKITILDNTPDSLKGLALYTGSDREGISQANDQPPLCKDAAPYRDMVLYGNVTNKPSLKLTLLGVSLPGGTGLQAGDVITLTPTGGSAVTLTAVSGTPSAGQFQVVTSGTPSQNITDTANNLISAINYAPGLSPQVSPIYAYLLSGASDLPGQILLQSKNYTEVAISVSAHGTTAWTPTIDAASSQSLVTEYLPNTLLVSKSGQGVSVPSANAYLVGDSSSPIVRVIALREYALVLKTDGIYRVTGYTPSTLSVSLFDNTTRIVGPETAAVLTNAVWMLSNQGVVSISDTGVQIRSGPIKNLIDQLTGPLLSAANSNCFAVGYETQKKYILAAPTNSNDGFCSVQYVFNYDTQAWTQWDRPIYSMHVHPSSDRLYLGNADSPTISKERNDGTYADFSDEDLSRTITAINGSTVTLNDASGISIGDVLEVSLSQLALVTSVDVISSTVTIDNNTGIVVGPVTVKTAIDCTIQWKPVVNGNNPVLARQYSEGALLFRNTRFNFGTIGFFTDVDNSIEKVPIQGIAPGEWGFFTWGDVPWGGTIRPIAVRFYVPQNKQYASQLVPILEITNALSTWTLQGISISANSIGQEVPSVTN